MENSPKVQWYNGLEASTAIKQEREPSGEGYWVGQSMYENRGKYETCAVVVEESGVVSEHPLKYISLVKEFDSAKKLKELEARVEDVADMPEFTDKIEALQKELDERSQDNDNYEESIKTLQDKLSEATDAEATALARVKELEGDLADANAELEELTKE